MRDFRPRTRLIPWLLLLLGAACDPGTAPPATSALASVSASQAASSAAASGSATASAPPPAVSFTPATHTPPPVVPADPADIEAGARFAKGSNAFAMDLYGKLAPKSDNFVFSPVSLSLALTLTWAGAKGDTAAEMRKVLHLEGDDAKVEADARGLTQVLGKSGPAKLAVANRLFGMKSYAFQQSYLDRAQKSFGASLEPVDFRQALEPSRQRINDWVAQQTEQRIKDLVPSGGVDADTRLVLVNALYFKAAWEQPFVKYRTAPAKFSISKSESKDVPTMMAEGSRRHAELAYGQAVELDYDGGQLAMLLIAPKEVDGLATVEKELARAGSLDALLKGLASKEVSLTLPKFTIDPPAAISAGSALQALGMSAPFSVKKADFTGLANPSNLDEQLYLAKVFHKGFIAVDEDGTEAAAGSAVSLSVKGAKPPTPKLEVKLDRPFLYLIRDKRTGAILFMGKVTDPTKK